MQQLEVVHLQKVAVQNLEINIEMPVQGRLVIIILITERTIGKNCAKEAFLVILT